MPLCISGFLANFSYVTLLHFSIYSFLDNLGEGEYRGVNVKANINIGTVIIANTINNIFNSSFGDLDGLLFFMDSSFIFFNIFSLHSLHTPFIEFSSSISFSQHLHFIIFILSY